MSRRGAGIHSSRLHLVLYSMLLVATPLVMLRNFLQQAIAKLSDFNISIAGLELPIMLSIALLMGVVVLIWQFKNITWRHVLAIAIVLAMDALAQQFADYYSNHRFYDLQQNWHYIAYGLFAFMVYRDLGRRSLPLHRVLLITFAAAFVMSTSDELFQKYINTRVFDISDIAKDTYGAVAGMVLISLCSRRSAEFLSERRLRYPRLRDYFRHAFSTLVLIGTFSFLLIMTAALLSDAVYFFTALLIALAAFLVIWIILHLTQFKPARYTLLALLLVLAAAQTIVLARYWHDDIVYNRFGLTVYRGIPIPYFDIMIRGDGSFRLVDKKHEFLAPDRRHFLRQMPDILLIGSGSEGRGGNGFPTKKPSQFIYNTYSERGTHVIILRSPDACTTFNRLRKEGKNVLFILHNTC
jgi:VanZ family protein